jgi:hypothetical protein
MVSAQAADDRRVKVSLSLDSAVVEYLDAYVAAHPAINRSRVVELAVREFRQRQIEAELEAQYAEPEPEEIQQELEDWRHIRRTAARRALNGV